MLNPTFQVNLGHPITKGTVAVGKFDGNRPCLAAGTSSGKVMVHNPHETNQGNQLTFLNVNKDVNCVASGAFKQGVRRETLMIGTQTNLMAYNVDTNSDIYYRDVQDGVNRMIFGKLGSHANPLVFVGGNCSIQGYDGDGEEQFWTTAGGDVTSLCLADVNGDNENELLVGSDDYVIYIYQDESIIAECKETSAVTELCDLNGGSFGYALSSNTYGLYKGSNRIWKNKSKSAVNGMVGYDILKDGVPDIIVGYNSGKLEVRKQEDGRLIHKDSLKESVAGLIVADYRMDGHDELICCSVSGDLKGYVPAQENLTKQVEDSSLDELIEKLIQKREELTNELKNYEENLKKLKNGDIDSSLIRSDSKVKCNLNPNIQENCLDIVFRTDAENIIRSAIITAEQLFPTDTSMVYSKNPSNEIKVSLRPEKNIAVEMRIQVMVGFNLGSKYHIFNLSYTLPRFAMYIPGEHPRPPKSVLNFVLGERVKRIIMWLNESFNIVFKLEGEADVIDAKFTSLRDGSPLRLLYKDGMMTISVDDMEVAGDLFQDVCAFLSIKELDSKCDFPVEFEKFEQITQSVEEYNSNRLKMTAEMADSSQLIKAYVIKAEDSRVIADMKSVRSMYNELHSVNKGLIGEYKKRSTNHDQLLTALKEVNQMIQKAARLRIGEPKNRVVSECRKAIKNNNISSLFKIIKEGQ
ncbi:hypothetical protein NAEGRDRAFT_71257 [Naegleria gruberi]|uniref:Bardet-Biedl syndrome 2 protein homolog n=1 Tax=Naegleria gruberi TaxID=5762 RepID=D2VQK4_NAEGR|nr:uncharacterized protein NAEGRDRAFT_71257 [Naegleria gruberi]EFC40965.1 hypothetical protein NAEGRDRAFT_71257 [Naegleria gruberi]|eukprot:XP_002673709.1 hypothetical protein NAEGRDRAFT_71257 [Naegleria gruberi strain NEG-M]